MSTEVGTLRASLNLDIRSFANGVSEAVSLTKSLGDTLKTALGDSSQGFSSMIKEVASVREEVEKLRAEVKSLQAELNQAATPATFTQVQNHTSRLRENLTAATSSAQELTGAATGAEKAMRAVGDAGEKAYSLMDVTTGEILAMTSSAKQAGQATGQMAQEASKSAKQMRASSVSAKDTARNTKNAGREARTTARETNRIKNNLQYASTFAKDLKRIVLGIVISQAFYEMLNVVNELVRGSIKFANNMDQAQIAFKYLLEDATQSQAMINTLQDFAIHSPLNTTSVMDATRKLMAMGFTAKSVVPTLQVMTDTAAVFTSEAGDMADMIAHITLALGQMRASGKVMSQELRQLYNAGVPVFKILQEELHLTANEVRNIGSLGIDSGTAVIALLKGLQKRYTGAAQEFTKTIPGALEVIKDSVYVLYSLLAQAPQGAFKEWINDVAATLEALVIITRNYGPGGLLQAIFPPKLHDSIRAIIGSMKQLGAAFKAVGKIAGDIFGGALGIVVRALGVILPPITSLINSIAQTAHWLYMTSPLVRRLAAALGALLIVSVIGKLFLGLWKILKIGTILLWIKNAVIGVGKALISLAKTIALTTASNWKLVVSLLVVIAMLASVLSFSERARIAMQRFVDTFKNLDIKFDFDDTLQPDFNPPPTGDFDGGLKDIITDVDELGDSADSTTKKLSKLFNQSFDEVFLIDDSQGDALEDIENANLTTVLTGLDDILGKFDELSMVGSFWEDWGNIEDYFNIGDMPIGEEIFDLGIDFWEALKEAFDAPEWAGAGIGAAVVAVIGGLIGGAAGAKIGAAIGAAAGWVAGLFWDEIIKAFETVGLNETTALSTSIAAPLGAVIGGKIGGPLGALVGGAIGALVSWIIGEIEEGLDSGDWTGVSIPIGLGLGAAIGMIAGGPGGAAIGAAIGLLVGWIADLFIDGFTNNNWNEQGLGLAIGLGLGAAIGMIAGGPGGAAIGAAIGLLVGWLVGLIIDKWSAIIGWFKDVGNWFKELFSVMAGWFIKIATANARFQIKMAKPFVTAYKNIKAFFDNVWQALSNFLAPIAGVLGDLFIVIREIFYDIWDAVFTVVTDIKNATVTVFTEILDVVTEILDLLLDLIVLMGVKIWNAVYEFLSDIWETVSTWLSIFWELISVWFTDLWRDIVDWLKGVKEAISTWFNLIWSICSTWLAKIWKVIIDFFKDVLTSVRDFIVDVLKAFTTFLSTLWGNVKNGVANIYKTFKNWVSDLWNNVFSKFFGWLKDGIDMLREFFGLSSKTGSSTNSIEYPAEKPKISTFMDPSSLGRVTPMSSLPVDGHYNGGIFNKEHVAWISEDDKEEAVIPLQNPTAMQPFADSVAAGVISAIAPFIATQNSNEQLPPVYIGTLIADDRGLKELERKLRIIRVKEERRGI